MKKALLLLMLAPCLQAKTVTVSSPNQQIKVVVSDEQELPSYQVIFNDQTLISPSSLGFDFRQHPSLGHNAKISNSAISSHNETWQQPWGERQSVQDNHNKLALTFSQADTTFNITFKVFDDGIGFRYELPTKQGYLGAEISKELTQFNLTESHATQSWWIPAREWNRYEYVYNKTPLNLARHVHTPITLKRDDNIHLSIHEAALVDFAAMTLKQGRDGQFSADLTPWSDGTLVKTNDGFTTPWRTIQISDSAVGLANSDLILNLNEPNKLGNVDWVEPSKYVGIWWGMHIGENTWGSGDKHGATTQLTKEYIDFAAENDFKGVLVEGWNIGWDGDWFHNGDVFNFTQAYPDFNFAELAAYGKAKGVAIVGHHETSGNVSNYANQMQDAFALYQTHGVSQVKTGYVADGGNIKRIDEKGQVKREWHDGQFMVNEYLANVTLAAKHKISINTHEPIKDTGLRRTYPNWISREGARGQEYNAWGTPPNPPSHVPTLAFTRMLSGPMDFTPGIFDLSFNGLGSDTNRPQTTLAKQLALYVVLYSPIQMAADLPRNYRAKPEAFQFIKDVPTDWNQSSAIAGEVGEYIVFARQDKHSDDWYLGAVTDENARSEKIKLNFLEPNRKYIAQVYSDGENANWVDKPYEMAIYNKTVTQNDELVLKMAAGGGVAIRFKAL
ncbi:MAG: glycoside hydrolase family 97 protein [Pseudomonadota bacterium]|uniref:glycoside hydrolase family 97 protein n=1 Tax=Pseudoalteromonas TaxID=53246 RepID=UPI00026C9127|nr:glycoside hydrolase family 97 protein [Pseudoalteromonas spongiae]ATC99982.1 alpha-glucosidase [Pseudoalteromonas spongiae UST010723-006]MEC8328104.1 glycoside hydrolase family 97 protein [Pseudomonadota bacterium]